MPEPGDGIGSGSKSPREKFWTRERIIALASAVVMTIALPIAIDQGYFRYNVWALPCLGMCAFLIYIGVFISAPAVRSYAHDLMKFNRALCIAVMVILVGAT